MVSLFPEVENILSELTKYGTLDNFKLKESHPGKSLLMHVNECIEIATVMLDNMGLNDEKSKRLLKIIACTHDIGKLMPEWTINRKIRPKHANKGAKFLDNLRKSNKLAKILTVSDEITKAIVFLTEKHHSSLIFDWKYPKPKLANEEFLRLADIFGIFKLADIFSALNLDTKLLNSQYRWDKPIKIDNKLKSKAIDKVRRFDSQKYALQKMIASSAKKHIFLIAPTGWGKTAVSLLRMLNIRPLKVFYVLPTITAIKEFTEDLTQIFGDKIGEYFYFVDVDLFLKDKAREEIHNVGYYLADFYKYFLPKVNITTIDQILLTALQVGKYHFRRFNFRNSLLILDEFHLLTPQMIGALKAVFEVLGEYYNLRTVFMSATPSYHYIEELKKIFNKFEIEIFDLSREYKNLSRHRISIEDCDVFEFVKDNDKLRSKIDEGKRILFILNTVDRAIKLYDELKNLARNKKVLIIHSRFTYKDRSSKEEEIATSTILVATQVAEVSLDISFDILVTEIAPLPALIQRFGRVNRYGERAREINVWICKKMESPLPYLDLEIKWTEGPLERIRNNIEKKGEFVYLESLKNYEFNWGDINRYFNDFKNSIKSLNLFFATNLSLEEIQKKFGREIGVPVISSLHKDLVRDIAKTYQEGGNDYVKRRQLLAEIKQYVIPIPLPYFHQLRKMGECYWDEEINYYVVGGEKCRYSHETGLKMKKD